MILTRKIVRELLHYNQRTGKLRWKPRARRWFVSERGFKTWNSRYAGKEAFTAFARGDVEHRQGTILYCVCYAHQVIWLWMTGRWVEEIDHRNGIGADNRWCNLKKSTRLLNSHNAWMPQTSTRVHGGVSKRNDRSFRAVIKGKHLGYFPTLEKAIRARKRAQKKYGFTARHGTRRPI